MFSFGSILAVLACFTVALAQSTANVAFTSVPAFVVAGNSYNITWAGGDGTAVTLTLRKGDPNNLDTVDIIGSRITGNSYLWTVGDDLETASDYALQIQQGVNGINYSGQFAVIGGTGTSSISVSGITTKTQNGTITTQGMTMTRATASMGTGTNMPRNTTFSSQSLSSAPRTITTAASTSSRGTASTVSQATAAPNNNVGAQIGSSAAMVIGIFGAIVFLQ